MTRDSGPRQGRLKSEAEGRAFATPVLSLRRKGPVQKLRDGLRALQININSNLVRPFSVGHCLPV